MKILTVFGTRPEIIKLSILIKKLDKFFNHKVLFTGQNYDDNLSKIFFKDLNFRKPDYICKISKKSTVINISEMMIYAEKIINKFKPNAVVILGDTNSSFTSLVAKKYKIPLFHLEAGNRCFDERVPEEVNRRIIDHLSDINLVYTEHARRNLLREGISSKTIVKTGSPMPEIFKFYKKSISSSKILKSLKCKKREYILFSCHREENLDNNSNLNKMINFLNKLSNEYRNKKIIISTHPRLENKIKKLIKKNTNKNILFERPFNFSDYIFLQINAYCVFSDSGTLTEETSILKTKGIIIRENHERPEGDDFATCLSYDFDENKFKTIINFIDNNSKKKNNIPNDYRNLNFSEIVVNTIISKVNYVNKYIYFKHF